MKHILILLALIFSMTSVNAQTTNATTQANSAERDYQTGLKYYFGQGVEENETQAFIWFLKSANQGHAEAQYNVGLMYERGQGVEQSDELAFGWYEKAAEQGDFWPQFILGQMYEKGWGVEQNYILALKWYILSASNGSYQAIDDREFLTKKNVTPENK